MINNSESRSACDTIVIIPTYNEIENIKVLPFEIWKHVPDVDILVVDDNSPDGTGEWVATQSRLHLLKRSQKQGLGKAYRAGFAWAIEKGYVNIIEMDADFSHRPLDLKKIVETIRSHSSNHPIDFVVGSRYVRGGGTVNWGWGRQLISRGGSLYARIILGYPLQDWTGGFNAWRSETLIGMKFDQLQSEGYSFQIELKYRALRAGFKGSEVPIIFEERRVGQSKMSMQIVLEALARVWKMRFCAAAVLCFYFLIASWFFMAMSKESQAAATATAAAKGQVVEITAEQANVYSGPNYDSDIIQQVSKGQKFAAQNKIYGTDMKFYRIRIRREPLTYGYIAYEDVGSKTQSSSMQSPTVSRGLRNNNRSTASQKSQKQASAAVRERQEDERRTEEFKNKQLSEPMMYNKWYGLMLGDLFVADRLDGEKVQDQLFIYGLKWTGPDFLVSGPIIDFNLFFHVGAAQYWKSRSKIAPSGYVLSFEPLLLLPFGMGTETSVYLGVGPFFRLTDVRLISKVSSVVDHRSFFNVGPQVSLGWAWRMKVVSVRLESHFYFSKNSSSLFAVGLQTFL